MFSCMHFFMFKLVLASWLECCRPEAKLPNEVISLAEGVKNQRFAEWMRPGWIDLRV